MTSLETYFTDIIRCLTKAKSVPECSWDRYKLQTDAWKKRRDDAKEYMRSERGRMSLAAVSEQLGKRPTMKKINALAYMTDIQLHHALLTLETYLSDKISLKQNISARVEYIEPPLPTRIGIYSHGYSKQWYQSGWS